MVTLPKDTVDGKKSQTSTWDGAETLKDNGKKPTVPSTGDRRISEPAINSMSQELLIILDFTNVLH